MRGSSLARCGAFCGLALSVTSIASAFTGTPHPMQLGGAGSASAPDAAIPGDGYTVLTSLANASNQFLLVESTSTPTADDRVLFDFAPEVINNYITTPPVMRTVTESDVNNGNGTRTMSVTVNGTADLWPTGFVDGTQTPLTRGGFGIGITLPSAINGGSGSEGLAWDGATITALTMDFMDATGPTNGVPIPLTFINSTTNWNGIFGVVFSDTGPTGVTGFDTTMIRLNVTYSPVPEPTALAIALPAGAMLLRRRQRH